MRKAVLFCAIVSLAGCAVITIGEAPKVENSTAALLPSSRVTLGMTRAEIGAIMNNPVTVGYEIDPATGATNPVQVQSLYSAEILETAVTAYQVDYYIVHSSDVKGQIADENLLPLVYQNNILVAKGRDELKALKEKYQIK